MNENTDSGHCASISEKYTLTATITNHNGLHARPAAFISDTASGYKSRIYVFTEDGRKADASSVSELLSLALKQGETVSIEAKGIDAKEAAARISEIIDSGIREKEQCSENNVQIAEKDSCPENASSEKEGVNKNPDESLIFKGIAVCSRPVIGNAVFLLHKNLSYNENASLSLEEEKDNLFSAINAVRDYFFRKAENIYKKDTGSSETADIYYAYSAMASDPVLLEQSAILIQKGMSAAAAFAVAVKKIQESIQKNSGSIVSKRISDYDALLRNVLERLPKEQESQEDNIAEKKVFAPGTVIISDEVLPGDIDMDDRNIVGIAMVHGSPDSHFSVMAREAGLPLIVSAGERLLEIPENSSVALNISKGEILINPSGKKRIYAKIRKYNEMLASEHTRGISSAYTKDGIKISVSANAGSKSEALKAASAGAEGIGLLRTEFLFMNMENPPDEDFQAGIYSEIASAQKGHSVTVRLIDAGNDKTVRFMRLPKEKNPALGTRGIRAFDFNEEIFRTQIRAILRVIPEGRTRILLPMVSNVNEFKELKKIINSEAEKMGISKAHVGVMIEVPSAALMARQLAKYADFLSVGTNDLSQYAMAVDRNSSIYAGMADAFEPAVLRLVKIAAEGAAEYKREICVCGMLASQTVAIPLLIGLGIRNISVALPEIPYIKRIIRISDIKECEKLADYALNLENAEETRILAEKYIKKAMSPKIKSNVQEKDSAEYKGRIKTFFLKIARKFMKILDSCFDFGEKQDKKKISE